MSHRLIRVIRSLLLSREILLGAVVLGIGLRISSTFLISVGFDANYYLVMGESFSRTGEFLIPWGAPNFPGPALSYSHHMSPLWPMVLGSAFALFGYSVALAKAVSLIASLLVLPVTYVATRDLYGPPTALAATSVISLLPELILDVGRVYSENLTMIFFVLTIWETDAYLTSYTIEALTNPGRYAQMLSLTLILFGAILVSIGAYFGPEIIKSLRSIRQEEESGLWLGVALVPLVAAFIAAVFATFEVGGQSVLSIDRIRYVIYAFYPLLLVGVRGIEIPSLLDRHQESAPPGNLDVSRRKPAPRRMVALLTCVAFL